MTKVSNNVAYIIKRINEEWGKKPGKKILQKMVFLIEEKGIDLGYEYGLHFYGPYNWNFGFRYCTSSWRNN